MRNLVLELNLCSCAYYLRTHARNSSGKSKFCTLQLVYNNSNLFVAVEKIHSLTMPHKYNFKTRFVIMFKVTMLCVKNKRMLVLAIGGLNFWSNTIYKKTIFLKFSEHWMNVGMYKIVCRGKIDDASRSFTFLDVINIYQSVFLWTSSLYAQNSDVTRLSSFVS